LLNFVAIRASTVWIRGLRQQLIRCKHQHDRHYPAALTDDRRITELSGDPKAVKHQLRVQIPSVLLTSFHHFAPGRSLSPFTLIQFCSALLLHYDPLIHQIGVSR
jgi:hypothetical protein